MAKIKTNRKDVGRKTQKNLQNLINFGNCMSNICFNLSQVEGQTLLPAYQETMKESYKDWDAAKKELPNWIFKK